MRGKKFWAWLLTAALLLGLLPAPAMAAGPEDDAGDCPHHTEHTAECGYIAPAGAAPCQHECTEDCWREEIVCVHSHMEDCYSDGALPAEDEEKEADACAHVCAEESGCVILVPDCQHEHNGECGYVPADPGQPCGYICPVCPVQALLDTLPDAEDITESDRASVEEQLAAIDEARAELTDEETGQIDFSRYQAVVSALLALDEQAGADVPVTAANPAEQFPALTPGGTYWFDLSGAGIPGSVNTALPDRSFHWVPFTYAGTINAYSRNSEGVSTDQNVTPYDHSLFIADYVVTDRVSWDDLNASGKNMIFGTPYTSGGVSYTMRAPSVGSYYTGEDSAQRGTPQNNEWDVILDKDTGYIKNWFTTSWGQDTSSEHLSARAIRGTRYWGNNEASYRELFYPYNGFRPVLEILNLDTLTSDGLKVITLDLSGGKIGSETGTVNIVVKSSESFTAPSSGGLTRPNGDTGSGFSWLGDDGNVYAVGAEVPVSVNSMTALWVAPPVITTQPGNQTVAAGQTATFTITASDASAYQWQVNKGSTWEDISGETGSSYTTSTVTIGMNGWKYQCVVTNSVGNTTSAAATLTVQGPVPYINASGNAQTLTQTYTSVTNQTTWGTANTETWYVVDSNTTISNRITVSGNVNLILKDGCTLTASQGIAVLDGNSLTIYCQSGGTGALTAANPSDGGAAIGGNRNGVDGTKAGSITVNGGNITASVTNHGGACIGQSGWDGEGGTVTINGGYLKLSSSAGNEGAFGGGGTRTINGGVVEFTGYSDQNRNTIDSVTKNKGIVFKESAGQVYGSTVLPFDYAIPAGKTLTIPTGSTLTVSNGVALTNSGTIKIDGTLNADGGGFTNSGTVQVKVTLNAGSGMVSPSSAYVTYGQTYGSTVLPTPAWSGHGFIGWYTAETGGELVNDKTVTQLTGHNIYARWKNTPAVTAPTEKTDLTYTGNAQELISPGSTTGGCEMQYSLSQNSGYSTAIPKGTEAQTYTVYYKVVGNDTYDDVAAQSVNVTISPKSITGATVTLGDSLTYTGQQQTQTVQSVTIDGLTATYTVSDNQQTAAGEHTLTVTGTGNFTGTRTATFNIAKASNSITDLTCGNIVFGGTPSPTSTATSGTPAYSYSDQQNGTYGAWNTSNSKGTWYVKASVAETANYNGAEAVISFQVTAQREETPNAGIDYGGEKLTSLEAGASYSITPAGGSAVTVTADNNGKIVIQEGWFGKTLSIVKVARNGDYSDSEAQSLSIPARPNSPTVEITVTKTDASITVTNASAFPGCEFSIDGTSWQDSGAFSGLTAGRTYTLSVRVKATASSFVSASKSKAITTVNEDGSTTVKPGESVVSGDGTTITNDGSKITITGGGTTTTITPAAGVDVGVGGTVTVPSGSTIQTGNGPEIIVGPGNSGTVDSDGTVTVPEGGSVQIGGTTVTPPAGGEIKPKQDGTVDVPGGSTVQTGNGPQITVGPGNSGTVGGDSGVTVPDGGSVQVGNTTITPPNGGEVKPTGSGVTVPEGSTVQTGSGPEITVGPGNGGTVGGDGGVTVPGGGTVQVGDDPAITITLPTGGGTVKPNPDGTIPLPGGAKVKKDDTTITVPEAGGTYDPSTGTVTENVYTVTFDSQGGSAVSSQTVTAGGKVTKPSDPTRSGYNFGGWYKDSGYTVAWNFNTDTVTENITLYAKWTAKPTSGGGGGTYTPPTYPPTVEKPNEGGTVTISPSRPSAGDKVTVRPNPDNGYEVDKITVTDRNGKPVTVTKNPDGTYTFTQPNGTVKVEVIYKSTETLWSNPFRDVTEAAWYYEAVRYVSENGLMNGYSDGRFGPNDNLSRAQLAQILFNREGRPGVNYLLQFGDVPGDAWYTEAVRWATSQGIVSGYGGGRFGPNDNITREQLAVMLWRYAGSPAATNKELHFNDTDEISGFALDAMRWAVENGIMGGYGDGRLGPKGLATRAQVAQMLKNYFEHQ